MSDKFCLSWGEDGPGDRVKEWIAKICLEGLTNDHNPVEEIQTYAYVIGALIATAPTSYESKLEMLTEAESLIGQVFVKMEKKTNNNADTKAHS